MRREWLLGALTGVLVLVLLPWYVYAMGQVELFPVDRSHPRGELSPESSGGPDDWGYIYVDSDPPTPQITYGWIDLDATGWPVDTVGGLDDDNVVGPFPIGFDFPYYWYDVDEFYAGSNGYISFSDEALEASPFVQYPNTVRPNDVLGVFTDDIIFGPLAPTATCRWATNAAADTCVIDFLNVPFWALPVPTGNNTFQIILSKPDSTIRYQYYEQTGSGQSSDTRSVGWEDQIGVIGYSYLFGVNPPANNIHAGLAIAIYDTATAEPPIDDVGIEAVMTENSGAVFTTAGEPLDIWARIANVGNQIESSFDVRVTVKNAGGGTVLSNTQTVVLLNPGQTTTLTLATWTPTIDGLYTITVENLLGGDINPANDGVIVECHVVTLPATFEYVDDIIEQGYAWYGSGSGWGNYFIPPTDSVRISTISVNINSGTPCVGCLGLYVFDDSGPGGGPGADTLAGGELDYDGGQGWYELELSPKVEITDGGGWHVCYIQYGDQNPYMGMDTSTPFSRQGWDYTGAWSPSRHVAEYDFGIRCDVEPWSVPDVLVTIDEFQQTTVRGAVGVVPPNASLDFGVNFRNTTASLVSTQWWIHAYRSTVPNPIFTLGPFNLILGAGQDITKIYGLPVPSGVPTTDTYTVYVRVGSYPNVMHQDSFPVAIRPRGQQ